MDDGMGFQLFYLSWAVMGGPVAGDYKRDVSPAKKIVRTMDKQWTHSSVSLAGAHGYQGSAA